MISAVWSGVIFVIGIALKGSSLTNSIGTKFLPYWIQGSRSGDLGVILFLEVLRNRNGAVGSTVLPVKGKLDAFGGLGSKTGNGKDAFSLPMSNSEFGTSQQVA